MSEAEESIIAHFAPHSHVLWWSPHTNEAREVKRVAGHPEEPSRCAYFENGEYVALYNCELKEFGIWQAL